MNCKFKDYNLSNLMTIKELQNYLHIGKNKAYYLVNNNEVPTIRIGNKTYVVVDRLKYNTLINKRTEINLLSFFVLYIYFFNGFSLFFFN